MEEPLYHMDRYHPELIVTRPKSRKNVRPSPSKNPIVVDGNNVAYSGDNASMYNIKLARISLIEKGFDPIIVISSALFHAIDDKDELKRFYNMGWVKVADDQESDDVEIIEQGMRYQCRIVSNDRYSEYREIYAGRFDFYKLVRFAFAEGRFILEEF